MFEALEKERNERANTEAMVEDSKQLLSDPLLEVDSSEESESEADFVFGKSIENTTSKPSQRKHKLPRVVRNRIDESLEKNVRQYVCTTASTSFE